MSPVPPPPRTPPPPLRGGPIALVRFLRRHHMLNANYARLIARWAWLKLRYRGRLQTDGLCFVGPDVTFEIGPGAKVVLGRWTWLGSGCKVRVHEGELRIGAKTIIGQECVWSVYQHVAIGRECVIADRAMFIDFDHAISEVERPIRAQGIWKADVDIGHNVWVGYGAAFLRGSSVGDNSVVGTYAVVNKQYGDDVVLGGVPAKILRMRKAPQELRWED